MEDTEENNMNEYKHYIITDENNKIMDYFTSADKQKRNLPGKIEIGTGRRQFPAKEYFPLELSTNGEKNYKYIDGKILEIPEEEKTTAEEKKLFLLRNLENEYIGKIQNELGIERYRDLSNLKVKDILKEYDEKKDLIIVL